MGCSQRTLFKDAMTHVYALQMKGRGGFQMPLISDSVVELLGSGLNLQVYDCDIFVVVSDEPEDIGWELYKNDA